MLAHNSREKAKIGESFKLNLQIMDKRYMIFRIHYSSHFSLTIADVDMLLCLAFSSFHLHQIASSWTLQSAALFCYFLNSIQITI